MNNWIIYGLRLLNEVGVYRYVGLTTQELSTRMSQHISTALKGDATPKSFWIRKHYLSIVGEVLEVCPVGDKDYLAGREQVWVAIMREKYGDVRSDYPLKNLNVSDGGDGTIGRTMSDAQKSAISERMSGDNHWTRNLGNKPHPSRGKKYTEEHKKSISLATKGKAKHSEDQKRKWASERSGEGNPMYGRTGALAPNFGKPNPMKGKRLPEEHRENIKKAALRGADHPNYGVGMSEDQKLKLSESMRAVPNIRCPYCPIEGKPSNMKRWHFDNCKKKDQ